MKKNWIAIREFIFLMLFMILLYSIQLNSLSSREKTETFTYQKEQLQNNYPELASYTILDNHQQSFLIPNLSKTETLVNGTTNLVLANDMDPQGVVRAEDYLLISAYSRSHKYNSVLYVLDALTGDYLKTVVLQGTPHVGGLAYDTKHKNIWVCTISDSQTAQVVAIRIETLKKDTFNKTKKAIVYDQTINLGTLPEASFLTYHNESLYIGFFDSKHDGILTRFGIQQDGRFDRDFSHKIRLKSEHQQSTPESSYAIDKQIQGITFYKGHILISRSYGHADSKILIYNYQGADIDLDTEAIKVLKAPAYLEQIYAYKDRLYLIFESGTVKYRKEKNITVIDRVLQLNLNKLIP